VNEGGPSESGSDGFEVEVVARGLELLGELLFLFGGAATAWVALAGPRHGQHEHRRTPSILIAITVAWSLSWIGVLVSGWRFYEYEVGFWSMVISIGVVIAGTIVVWLSARHTAHEPDSAGGPEPPRPDECDESLASWERFARSKDQRADWTAPA
jgi:hypothetical protein